MDPSRTRSTKDALQVNGRVQNTQTRSSNGTSPAARHASGFPTVVAAGSSGIVVLSSTGELRFANTSARRLLAGIPKRAVAGTLGFPFVAGVSFEKTLGKDRDVEIIALESGWRGAPAWIATLFDITARKRAEAELSNVTARLAQRTEALERLANIDPLTELLNRRGLESALALELEHVRRSGAPLAAVLLDLDDFKRINDSLGQAGGDGVLREVARRMQHSLRPLDHLARIGGDEFLALLHGTRLAQAVQVAERLRLSVSGEQLPRLPVEWRVSASLGVVAVPAGADSVDVLLGQVQNALRHSKRNGKNRGSAVAGSIMAADPGCIAVLRQLRSASSFHAFRRPVVRLRDESVVAWELIARGPPGTFEDPRDYLRLAREHGMLTDVDLHGLQTCLVRANSLLADTRRHVSILPATLLAVPVADVLDLLARHAAGMRLCICISEQQIPGDPAELRDPVRALKHAGHRISVVDVGFGRGSLETLILLEPDQVGLDPEILRSLGAGPGRERSLRRMLAVVQSLGSELLVDGIETPDDLSLLKALGVPCGQGPIWGPPT